MTAAHQKQCQSRCLRPPHLQPSHLVLNHSHSQPHPRITLLTFGAVCTAPPPATCVPLRGARAQHWRDWRALCRKPLSSRHLASLPSQPPHPHLALNTLPQAFNPHLNPFTTFHLSPVEKSCRVCVGCPCTKETKTFLLCIIAAVAAGKVSFVAMRPMLLVGGGLRLPDKLCSLRRQKMSFSPWGVNLLGRHPGSLNVQRKRSVPNTSIGAMCHFGGKLTTFTLWSNCFINILFGHFRP